MSIDAVFAQFFDNIHDPRQHAKIYYPFYDVLFLTVCAVIGGAEGWEDIEDFGEVHLPGFNPRDCLKTAFLSMTPLPGSSPASNQSRFRPPLCGGLKPLTSTPMAPWSLSMAKPCAVPMTVRIERRPFTWSVPMPPPISWCSDR